MIVLNLNLWLELPVDVYITLCGSFFNCGALLEKIPLLSYYDKTMYNMDVIGFPFA